MSKLKVKNFGPIKNGLANEEFFSFDKVTLLIGNQATGKSSVAKLFSTLTWLEKAITKEDIKASYVEKYNRFVKTYCSYQGIKNYFNKKTHIEYVGNSYSFSYIDEKLTVKKSEKKNYLPPQIMYVPAERNFLSVVEDPQKIKYLPLPLYTFLDELERSKVELKGAIKLPINKVEFEYQKQNKISYIKGDGFRLRLHEASSGIQSLLPVFLVSRNLANSITEKRKSNVKSINVAQENRIKEKVKQLLNNTTISDEVREILIERLSRDFQNLCFINIVEEIEQNLFPNSQRNLLNELLRYNNKSAGNKLILTSHSPYVLNYLTIAIKGATIEKEKLNEEKREQFEKIIPLESCVSSKVVSIYEFSDDGSIRLLPNYNGIPSDSNFLNNSLFQTNELFDDLLEIEEELI